MKTLPLLLFLSLLPHHSLSHTLPGSSAFASKVDHRDNPATAHSPLPHSLILGLREGKRERKLPEKTPQLDALMKEYEIQLNDSGICENSFLNSFLKLNIQNTQRLPAPYDESKVDLKLCPGLKETCCDQKIVEVYYEEHKRFYSDQLALIPKLDRFLSFISRVDDVIINHLIRKKSDFN